MRRGIAADDAFELIRNARGVDVPDTEQQRAWAQISGAALREGETRAAHAGVDLSRIFTCKA